jgi:Xaa-Pro dipeptidase
MLCAGIDTSVILFWLPGDRIDYKGMYIISRGPFKAILHSEIYCLHRDNANLDFCTYLFYLLVLTSLHRSFLSFIKRIHKRFIMNRSRSLKHKIGTIQKAIRAEGFDGWLLYDFRKSNVFASQIMAIPSHLHRTRRTFYFIPARGTPQKLVHNIESGNLDHLPGKRRIYIGWRSLEEELARILIKAKKVAMEYSPRNALPYVSVVDAGIIELVKRAKVSVVSSANLIQRFEAVWSPGQYRKNKVVARHCLDIMHLAFEYIRTSLMAHRRITEYDVQEFIVGRFREHNLVTDYPPNCSVNANSANPHYEPTPESASRIMKGDFVLIDLWAKADTDDATYADITWVGYAGESVPPKYTKIFNIVRDARNAAFEFVKDALKTGKSIRGCDVDDVARHLIEQQGYGKYFIHRTGHSIGKALHDNGANLDNLETKDIRKIIPESSFTIEPGIYFPGDFGVRSEIDVFIEKTGKVVITAGPAQSEVIPILR